MITRKQFFVLMGLVVGSWGLVFALYVILSAVYQHALRWL
jgi:hypothetical protein